MKIIKPTGNKNHSVSNNSKHAVEQADQPLHSNSVDIDDFSADFEKPVAEKVDIHDPSFKNTKKKQSKKLYTQPKDNQNNKDNTQPHSTSKKEVKSEYSKLLHKGIHFLSIREHSVQELQDKLSNKTDSPELVEEVMIFLLDNDYVSDARFAEVFVRSRAKKGQGPIKIRADLKNKGVKSQLIDEHLDQNSAVWFDSAADVYQKKFKSAPVEDYQTWTKCARFLQSRGFTMEHIHSTVPPVNND